MNPSSPTNQAAEAVARLFDAHVCSIYEVCLVSEADGEEPRKQLQLVGSFGWDRIKTSTEDKDKRHGPNPELIDPACPAPHSARPARWIGMTTYVGFQNRPLRCNDLRKKRVVKKKDGPLYAVEKDEKACEVPETGGSYLGIPIKVNVPGETEVLGVVYCIRFFEDCSDVKAKKEPFSKAEKQYLEYYQTFLGIAMSQEKIRSEQVHQLLGIAMVPPSIKRPLDQIAKQAHSLVPADVSGAAVFLEDPEHAEWKHDNPVYRCNATTGRTIEVTYRAGNDSLTGWVIKNRKPLITGDLKRDLGEPDGRLWKMDVRHQDKPGELASGDARSFAAVPIARDQEDEEPPRVIGVIRVSSKHPHAFTYHDLRMLQALAQQTERILLEQEKLQEETEAKKKETEAKERERMLFRNLEDASERPIIAADRKGTILRFNEAASKLLGIEPRDAVGQSIVDVVYGGNAALALETRRALVAQGGRLRGHYSLCFRRYTRLIKSDTGSEIEQQGIEERIVIPVRVSAKYLEDEESNSGDVGEDVKRKLCGSIGYLEDLRGEGSDEIERVTWIEVSAERKAFTADAIFSEQVEKIRRMEKLAKIHANKKRKKERELPASVVITGETGSGKDVVFEAIASALGRTDRSKRAVLNCATLTDTLMAAELFGAVPGAFTGAPPEGLKGVYHPDRNNGTVFLDEVHHLKLEAQAQLLRVIDKGVVRQVGGTGEIELKNVLTVLATNEDLQELVKKGEFRNDLMYRMRGIVIEVPPLRERPADVMQLATHFLEEQTGLSSVEVRQIFEEAKKTKKPFKDVIQDLDVPIGFDSDAIEHLLHHNWPGNVRELKLAIATAVSDWCSREKSAKNTGLITEADLPKSITEKREKAGHFRKKSDYWYSRRGAKLPDLVEHRVVEVEERLASLTSRVRGLEQSAATAGGPETTKKIKNLEQVVLQHFVESHPDLDKQEMEEKEWKKTSKVVKEGAKIYAATWWSGYKEDSKSKHLDNTIKKVIEMSPAKRESELEAKKLKSGDKGSSETGAAAPEKHWSQSRNLPFDGYNEPDSPA